MIQSLKTAFNFHKNATN